MIRIKYRLNVLLLSLSFFSLDSTHASKDADVETVNLLNEDAISLLRSTIAMENQISWFTNTRWYATYDVNGTSIMTAINPKVRQEISDEKNVSILVSNIISNGMKSICTTSFKAIFKLECVYPYVNSDLPSQLTLVIYPNMDSVINYVKKPQHRS